MGLPPRTQVKKSKRAIFHIVYIVVDQHIKNICKLILCWIVAEIHQLSETKK